MGTIQFQKVGIGYKIAVCSKKLHQLGVSQIAEPTSYALRDFHGGAIGLIVLPSGPLYRDSKALSGEADEL